MISVLRVGFEMVFITFGKYVKVDGIFAGKDIRLSGASFVIFGRGNHCIIRVVRSISKDLRLALYRHGIEEDHDGRRHWFRRDSRDIR